VRKDDSPQVNPPRSWGSKTDVLIAGVAFYFAAKHVFRLINGAKLISFDSFAAGVCIAGLIMMFVEIVRGRRCPANRA